MNPASDYARPFPAKPQPLTLEQAAWITPPVQAVDTEAMIDVPRMRAYRQHRLREQTAALGLDALVLVEPLSIRYATGVRNCALFQMHIQAGYLFLPVDGPAIYFDSTPGRETGARLETIDEIRDALLPLSYMFAGHRQQEWTRKWAAQMGELIRLHCGVGAKVGLERAGAGAQQALEGEGFEVVDSAEALARARKIKSPEEILAMNLALAVAEDGMTRMRERLRNGVRWPVIYYPVDAEYEYDGTLEPGMVMCGVLRHRRAVHARGRASRGRPRHRDRHRVPPAPGNVRHHHRQGADGTGLRRPRNLPGQGRERHGLHPALAPRLHRFPAAGAAGHVAVNLRASAGSRSDVHSA